MAATEPDMKNPAVDPNEINNADDDDEEYYEDEGLEVDDEDADLEIVPVDTLDEEYEDGEYDEEEIEAMRRQKINKHQNDPKVVEETLAELRSLDILGLSEWIHKPIKKNYWIECHIKRVRTGITKLSRKFEMYTDSGSFLMASKKQPRNKTSNYLVSVDAENLKTKDENYTGKIRSNFLGSEFMAYRDGCNPKNVKEGDDPREEIAAITYSSHLLGKKPKGPRKINVVLPFVNQHDEVVSCRALDPQKDGLNALEAHHSQTTATEGTAQLVSSFCSKNAKWNEKMKSYVLNFDNRVTEASVKNFQLISVEDPDTLYLQFGRVSKDTFNLDFQWPLTPFQAFSIAISSLDYKICSE